jgi:hypothetical protein
MKKVGISLVVTGIVYACGGAQPAPNTEVAAVAQVDGGATPSPPPSASSPTPTATSTSSDDADGGVKWLGGQRLCGCKLCAPVVSDDACSSDADCAPEEPCHAKRCVGTANAKGLGTKAMCSRIMMCHTTDANSCGCYNGKCALVPRP